jgi:hypothetical protein
LDAISLILPVVLIIGMLVLFVRISIKIRRGGGSMLTICSGATDEFLNRDCKKAVEQIVEMNAGKKMEEQSSSDPKNKKNDPLSSS